MSSDGDVWFLIGASPDIRAQIESFEALHPRGPRHSPIHGFVLPNGDLDACLGLLSVRESHPIAVYATEKVRQGFVNQNVLYRTLERFEGQVTWHTLRLGEPCPLLTQNGDRTDLLAEPVAAPGKVPPHLQGLFPPTPEDNIGLVLRESGHSRTLAYFPSVAAATPELQRVLDQASCVFFDGTFSAQNELSHLDARLSDAREMAHWPIADENGSLAFLSGCAAPQKILIHINNTNPILFEDSIERKKLIEAGIEVAYDGMEVVL